MTLFSSRPPFNDDPEPYRAGQTRFDAMAGQLLGVKRDPRPEYDRPQHNPTNPILVAAREDIVTWVDTHAAYEWWAEDFELAPDLPEYRDFNQVQHARKILTRLEGMSR